MKCEICELDYPGTLWKLHMPVGELTFDICPSCLMFLGYATLNFPEVSSSGDGDIMAWVKRRTLSFIDSDALSAVRFLRQEFTGMND